MLQTIKRTWLVLALSLFVSLAMAATITGADGVKTKVDDTSRVVVLGKELAETISAFDKANTLVGRDLSSIYPQDIQKVPDVGYIFSVGAEGVLSKKPTLIMADTLVKPETIQQWRSAGVPVLVFKTPESPAAVRQMINTVGQVYNSPQKAQELIQNMNRDLNAANKIIRGQPPLKTLTIISNGTSLGYAAPKHPLTPFVKLLGLNPVGGGEYVGDIGESIVALAPDLFIYVNRAQGNLETLGGKKLY